MGPRVKFFCWKLLHDIVPSDVALISKGVYCSVEIRVCGLFEKSLL